MAEPFSQNKKRPLVRIIYVKKEELKKMGFKNLGSDVFLIRKKIREWHYTAKLRKSECGSRPWNNLSFLSLCTLQNFRQLGWVFRFLRLADKKERKQTGPSSAQAGTETLF